MSNIVLLTRICGCPPSEHLVKCMTRQVGGTRMYYIAIPVVSETRWLSYNIL